MTKILQNKTGIKPWVIYVVSGILLGSVVTNRVDNFFNTYTLGLQSPVVVKQKMAEPVFVKVYATPSASPEMETTLPEEKSVIKKGSPQP